MSDLKKHNLSKAYEFFNVYEELAFGRPWNVCSAATMPDVGIHADSQGQINVNLWLTPDQANLNPENGGLVIDAVMAPEDWDLQKYRIQDILPPGPCQIFRIPYRANRVVFFDSGLFHASDSFAFRSGYLNRRTNLTFLFGRRSG